MSQCLILKWPCSNWGTTFEWYLVLCSCGSEIVSFSFRETNYTSPTILVCPPLRGWHHIYLVLDNYLSGAYNCECRLTLGKADIFLVRLVLLNNQTIKPSLDPLRVPAILSNWSHALQRTTSISRLLAHPSFRLSLTLLDWLLEVGYHLFRYWIDCWRSALARRFRAWDCLLRELMNSWREMRWLRSLAIWNLGQKPFDYFMYLKIPLLNPKTLWP